uniref:Uncharacterized protein n=1 Tax=Sinocyclocheilus anshuiensis TaxID=1608454 RepID=A0A671SU46_9TELE
MRSAHHIHLISAIRNGFSGIMTNHYLRSDTESVRLLELSTSVKTLQYDLKQSDIAKSGNRKLFFDTRAMVHLLEESGFMTQHLADVHVLSGNMMVNITNSNMVVMYGDMATKMQQVRFSLFFHAVLVGKESVDALIEVCLLLVQTADFDRKLIGTRNELLEMHSEQDRHVTQTNMKIDTEVAGRKTMLESHKLDTIKYLAGSVFMCLTVILGFYRIWM